MIKYNSNNIVIGQIKQLLNSFNLPKCVCLNNCLKVNSLPEGDDIIEGKLYLFNRSVYIGYFDTIDDVKKTKDITINNKIYIHNNVVYRSCFDENKQIKLTPTPLTYRWGKKLDNITKNLNINNIIYDSYTHKYLGEYLRFLRDYQDLDLMSLYNCFSNEMPSNMDIAINIEEPLESGEEAKYTYFDSKDELHKIYMLPVKFNKKYTIALNTNSPVEIFCYFYNKGQYKAYDLQANWTYMKRSSCNFRESFIYDKLLLGNLESLNVNSMSHEDNLYMFIKVSSNYDSSIVVLEGDYTASNNVFIDKDGYTQVCYKPCILNNTHLEGINNITRPQLLFCPTQYSYPFADRLLEYLSNNVIDKREVIRNNVKKVQNKLLDNNLIQGISSNGRWTDELTAGVLLSNHKHKTHRQINKDFDCLGYYDTSVENSLGSFKEEE